LGREVNMANDLAPELSSRKRAAWGAFKSVEEVAKKKLNCERELMAPVHARFAGDDKQQRKSVGQRIVLVPCDMPVRLLRLALRRTVHFPIERDMV
uniref:Reverse transcriptase domain-containing protein n=1 Tax=Heligmosomoides polygyrus TaxID=6339 RepID=A0A183F2J1_HELPZ